MGRWYSIPGVSSNRAAGDWVPVRERLRADPRFAEYYASKGQGPPVSGFQPGEEVDMKGVPARVIHEEYDQHRGEVDTWVRESSRCDSGTRKLTWSQDGAGRLVVSRIQKVTE
jgi:hypothetical protein